MPCNAKIPGMSYNIPIRPGVDRLPAAPIEIHRAAVQAEWIDYNGHMNVAYYVLAFDHATDRFFDLIDLGVDYVGRTNNSAFVLETHVTYAQEVKLDDPLRFTLQLIDADAKRLHYYFEMFHADDGFLAATSEQICMHVNLDSRRSEAFPDPIRERVAAILAAQRDLPRPDKVGRVIGIPRKVAAE